MTATRISGSHPSQHPGAAGIAEIRSHFPALERTHLGHPVAYFDGPGGTQVPREVVQAAKRLFEPDLAAQALGLTCAGLEADSRVA